MLDDLGEVDAIDVGRDDPPRVLTLTARVPDPENELAVIEYREIFERSGREWFLHSYAYELQLRPGPGRRAFHSHDGIHHFHCVDPARPDRDHHFRGHGVDVFEAHRAFLDLLAEGTITCEGLFPMLAVLTD